MKILDIRSHTGELFPVGLKRIEYQSSYDDIKDWALLYPGCAQNGTWIIVIHGHGSSGDQLYTRQDIREHSLPGFLESGAGILTANLRGNAWMGPAAAHDMHELIEYLRNEHGLKKAVFSSGSMGGTSNLIYATLYPGDVSVVVARGAASDLSSYYNWCLQKDHPIIQEIAEAIRKSYGGTPKEMPELYAKHSVLKNAEKLTMPVYLSHGGDDQTIPVEQSRALAEKLKDNKLFFYTEISGGNHDSPLFLDMDIPI
jgi:pimeloyl-ACP methyl ester carboxylesterase